MPLGLGARLGHPHPAPIRKTNLIVTGSRCKASRSDALGREENVRVLIAAAAMFGLLSGAAAHNDNGDTLQGSYRLLTASPARTQMRRSSALALRSKNRKGSTIRQQAAPPPAPPRATEDGDVTLQNLAAYYQSYLIFNQCATRLHGYFSKLAASVKEKIDAKHFADGATDGIWKNELDTFNNAIAPAFDRADDDQVSRGCEAVARLYEPNAPTTQVQKP